MMSHPCDREAAAYVQSFGLKAVAPFFCRMVLNSRSPEVISGDHAYVGSFYMSFILITVLFVFLWPFSVAADCIDPTRTEGTIIYNADYKVAQFCNGSDWIGMAGGASAVLFPAGAVIPFNLSSCPPGWSEYILARGRFIRGIDSTGAIDPDGIRSLESIQEDMFKSHSHGVYRNISGGQRRDVFQFHDEYMGNGSTVGTTATGGAETRPKNVALLYCVKD